MKWWLMPGGLLALCVAVYVTWSSDSATPEDSTAESAEKVMRHNTPASEAPSTSSPMSRRPGSLGSTRSADPESARPTRIPEQADEQTIASSERRLREDAVRYTHDAYRLLFEDLGLTADETAELFAYLVEVRIAGAWTRYRNGREITEEERTNAIRALIDDAKTQEFLNLEANLVSYHETSRIEALMGRSEAALTTAQRDRLFETLVETRAALVDLPDFASIEDRLTWMNERERRVMEIVPSFLTGQQVVYLDRQYQKCSQQRVAFLERESRRESQNPGIESRSYPLCTF